MGNNRRGSDYRVSGVFLTGLGAAAILAFLIAPWQFAVCVLVVFIVVAFVRFMLFRS
jgi:hypothetical protein